MARKLIIAGIAIAVLAPLSACGVKPGSVSPPDPDKSTFPQTYPNPNTDP